MNRKMIIEAGIIGAMILESFIGVALGETNWSRSRSYWLIITLLFAVGTMTLVWMNRTTDTPYRATLLRLCAHWFGVLSVVMITFFLVTNGDMTRGQAGMMLSLILALGVFLCGLYVDLRLVGVGAALAAVAPITMLFEQYLLLIALIGVVAFGVAMGGGTIRRHLTSRKDPDAHT